MNQSSNRPREAARGLVPTRTGRWNVTARRADAATTTGSALGRITVAVTPG